MIYTVTINPSIDYIVQLDKLTLGEVNRMDYDNKLPGGKGINVSRILKELGHDNIAWGFLGGFTGNFVKEELEKVGLKTDFTPIAADTRINVKIKAQNETEINGQGPKLTEEEISAFTEKFDHLTSDDVVIFAGSLVPSLNDDFYFDLIKIIRSKGAQFVIDTTGESLRKTLVEKPLVVKPNNHELADLFGVEFNGIDDIVKYGRKLLDMGAQNVLISMGKDGALLVTENDEVFASSVAKGEVVNSVGAGDSMVAGFISGYLKSQNYEDALRLGAASGGATAFSSDLAIREFIDKLVKEIKIQKIK